MADRYWVGGSGDWYDTNRWAATSGGTPGASVPTFSDNVFIDGNSDTGADIVISQTWVAETNDFTITGVGYNVIFSVTQSYEFQYTALTTRGNVYWTENVSWGSFANRNFYVDFQAPASTSKTVEITSSISGTWFVAFTSGAGATLDLDVTGWDTRQRSGVVFQGAGTINLNASVIRGSSVSFANGTTINAGTSTTGIINGDGNIIYSYTINPTCNFNPDTATTQVSSSAIRTRLNLNGKSIYNFLYDGNTNSANFGLGYYVEIQTAAVVLNNFTVDCATNSKFILQSNNLTIGGTFSVINTAPQSRYCLWLPSTSVLAWPLTLNGSTNLTDWWMAGVYVRGSAAPVSGTRLGNLGRNRNIDFGAPRTVYRIGTGSWNDNQWSDTSGGTPNVNFIPLPQDTAVYDESTTAGTQNINGTYVSGIDASTRTTALTLTFSTTTYYGGITLGSGITPAGSGTITFASDDVLEIDSAGKTLPVNLTINSFGGGISLLSALNIAANTITVTNGSFDTQNYNVTAAALSSNNSNVRSITLGSSTVTLSGASPIVFTTVTNFTFDAGTSTIACASGTFSSANQTFYDVSFTATTTAGATISGGTNTFNNLSITTPSSAGSKSIVLANDITVNGTFSNSASAGNRRVWIQSNSSGTVRTITANAVSFTDVDFRDITLAGSAAGAAPTRAGDYGNNSGIVFPAPKTVYWNLYSTIVISWYSDAWATTSSGTPNTDNFPLPQDTATFTNQTASQTIAIGGGHFGNIDTSARTNALWLQAGAGASTTFFYGDWNLNANTRIEPQGTAYLNIVGVKNQTITQNGANIYSADEKLTINKPSGTVSLGGALTIGIVLTLTSGTFDAVTYNVTASGYSGGVAGTLKMGSGLWTLSGTGTVWSQGGTLLKGTADILLSNNSTTARTFAGGGLSYNKVTIGGTTSTSTTTITGNNQFKELDSTKTVAHTIALGTTVQTFGKWSVTGTSGNVVTLTGTGTSHIIAGDATSGIDYLAMGSIGFAATSPGEFYAGVNSTGTAAEPVFRTAPPAARTLYWVGGTGDWSDTARWSLSSGGAGGEAVPRSMDDVVFDSSSNATGYTATVTQITGGNRLKSLTISGPATGNLTLAGTVELIIHDDITLPATGLTRTYTGTITLSSSQTGRTFTSNGVVLAAPLTVNGVGCEWTLADALNIGTGGSGNERSLTVTNGSFDTGNYNFTGGLLASANNNKRSIIFGSSTVTLSRNFGQINFGTTENNRADLTFNAGTSTINVLGTVLSFSSTINGNNQTFYNFSISEDGDVFLNGNNTFNNFTLERVSGRPAAILILSGNQTVNGTFTAADTNALTRPFISSDVLGTTRTITAATFSADDCNFRDITLAGVAAGTAPIRANDLGGNSGITFPAPKTVYRVGTGTSWAASSSWALTSGGSGSDDNFPLAQDTAIINDDTALTGTLSLSGNLPAVDCSTRTTGITLNFGSTSSWYGSLTLSSAITVTATGTQTFASRSRTMTLTSAGKTLTFPITVNAVGGTFELGDAMTMSNAITHTQGTLNANNYNLTTTTFASNNSNTRTLAVGSGTWTISGSGTSAWTAATSTGLTVTGTGVIKLTSASTKTFVGGGVAYTNITLDHGGTGALTISGNNTFKNIINTSGGATTISLAATIQRVSQWTGTGASGSLLTLQGTSTTSPAILVLTGLTAPNVDYLSINNVAAYSLTDTWYAGTNSNSTAMLGWYFQAATPPPPAGGTGNMFLLFI
jgi:hypothetical protein